MVGNRAFWRRGDEEDLGGRWFFGGSLGFGWPDDEVRDGGGLAAGFVGVEGRSSGRFSGFSVGGGAERRR